MKLAEKAIRAAGITTVLLAAGWAAWAGVKPAGTLQGSINFNATPNSMVEYAVIDGDAAYILYQRVWRENGEPAADPVSKVLPTTDGKLKELPPGTHVSVQSLGEDALSCYRAPGDHYFCRLPFKWTKGNK
ncbi:MAG: hypothetical protein ACHQ49_05120 [Elusimicrobiota bacterium]